MIEFDPYVMHDFADRLYSRVNTIVVLYGLLGVLIGGVIGGAVIAVMPRGSDSELIPLIGIVVGLVLGVVVGRDKAFNLRLEAQRTLCQLRVEQNTRKAESTTTAGA